MIRRNEPWIVLMVGLALCVTAVASHAQQAPPQEVIEALAQKTASLQQDLDRMFLASAHDKAVAAKAAADAEAREATLIEWLKAAQTGPAAK